MRLSRADDSAVARWWFTIDRAMLVAIAVLVITGLLLSLAASPAIALKKSLPAYFFFERHVAFAAAGFAIMIVLSFFSAGSIRRFAAFGLMLAIAALFAVMISGETLNGARRWLSIAGMSLQPSEVLKPCFVVVAAWLLAEAGRRRDVPALPLAAVLLGVCVALLIAQPDLGQTILLTVVWSALYALAGLPLQGLGIIAVLAIAGLTAATLVFPHVAGRLAAFVDPASQGNLQLERAANSFTAGGFFGRGPGEGTIKTGLPDAHTDFIFAVVAEEYGVVACLVLLALFGFITLRALAHGRRIADPGTRLGVQGLALVFGLQALINMGVNVGLLPAKGMTLPLISAGGSSLIAIFMTLGFLLALTRRSATATSAVGRVRYPVDPAAGQHVK